MNKKNSKKKKLSFNKINYIEKWDHTNLLKIKPKFKTKIKKGKTVVEVFFF